MQIIGYIRPRHHRSAAQQRVALARVSPDSIAAEGEDVASLIDAVRLLRAGDRLAVAALIDLARGREAQVEAIAAIAARGAGLIIAETGDDIAPECMAALAAGVAGQRRDTDPAERSAAGRRGGEARGYDVADKERWRALWQSDATAAEIEAASGMSYATLWRHFSRRPVPVPRGRKPGRKT